MTHHISYILTISQVQLNIAATSCLTVYLMCSPSSLGSVKSLSSAPSLCAFASTHSHGEILPLAWREWTL